MNDLKEKMGSMIKTPMTRDEAVQILDLKVEGDQAKAEPEQIMQRFETLFEKNLPEKGGSFYI